MGTPFSKNDESTTVLPVVRDTASAVDENEKIIDKLATDNKVVEKSIADIDNTNLSSRGLIGMHPPINIDDMLKDPEHESTFEGKEEVYIPYDIAREQISGLVHEMKSMKDSNLLSLASVEDNFIKFQSETRSKYEAFVESLREKSLDCIQNYKSALERQRTQLRRREEAHEEKEERLNFQIREAEETIRQLEAELQQLESGNSEPTPRVKRDSTSKTLSESSELEEMKDLMNIMNEVARDFPHVLPRYVLLSEELIVAKQDVAAEKARQTMDNKPDIGALNTLKVRVLDIEKQLKTLLSEGKRQQMQKKGDDTLQLLRRATRLFQGKKEVANNEGDQCLPPMEEESSDSSENTTQEQATKNVLLDEIKDQKDLIFKLQEKLRMLWEEQQRQHLEQQQQEAKENMVEEEQKMVEEKKENGKQINTESGNEGDKRKTVEEKKEGKPMTVEVKKNEDKPMTEQEEKNEDKPMIVQEEQRENKPIAVIEENEEKKEDNPTIVEEDLKDDDATKADQPNTTYEAQISVLQETITKLKQQVKDAEKMASNAADKNPSTKRYLEKVKAAEKKLKESEKNMKEARNKATRLEKELEKLKRQGGGGSSPGGASSVDTIKLKKELDDVKKKQKKQIDELEKSHAKTVRNLESKLKDLEAQTTSLSQALEAAKSEMVGLKDKGRRFQELEEQHKILVERTAETEMLKANFQVMSKEKEELEKMYKEEQLLRKKYWNMMEDMKGKIRVYARCRPMAGYEKEKNCQQVVQFLDDCTMTIDTSKGTKSFVYDQCFGPQSTQEEIFEDTKNLIQSSLDGYNVCVFAYGQTGSGKTFTMVGSKEMPGIVRRSVREIFKYRDEAAGRSELVVKLYMLELYLDNLVDLLYTVKKKRDRNSVPNEPPRLDIKKDKTGTVFVKGSQMVEVTSAEELFEYFELANDTRKVASTAMNEGSSRSHLIFSLVLENTDLASKKTSVGKLSLVDLAGSESQKKTGATDDRLKEAMSINKSLSALGDVISALSTGEKFIPYRNNKLTQVMSDSLGGNAKTLMFVNISPADYNAEETVSSLTYASRVKLITNTADKSQQSEEVSLLKKIVKELKESGGTSETLNTTENITL